MTDASWNRGCRKRCWKRLAPRSGGATSGCWRDDAGKRSAGAKQCPEGAEVMRAAHPPARSQTTVARPVHFSGPGLHTGRACRVVVAPAPVDYGIRWQRIDLPGQPVIPEAVDCVVATDRATTIGLGEAEVQTIEHLMAALFGLGVDNVLVRVDGPEPPFADGAAAAFARRLQEAGFARQDAPRKVRVL